MSAAFLLTSLAVVVSPGTGAILTITAGLRGGHRLSLVTALGCTLGVVPHLVAAITGAAVLLQVGGIAFEVLRVVGVCYLLYLAVQTWRDRGLLEVGSGAPASTGHTIATAVLANLLNPKLTLFFFAFLPQFITAGSDAVPQMLLLSAVFMAMTLVVFAAYGVFASAVRRHVVDRPAVVRTVQRVFSLGYVGLGAKLATTRV